MSNQNIIFAIARDTNQGAMSVNGTSWSSSNTAPYCTYRGLSGVTGKFVYLTYDSLRRYTINSYTIVDDTNWKPSVMPAEQHACTVAIAEGMNTLFYSFDGTTFITGPVSV